MPSDDIKMNFKGLDALLEAFKNPPTVKVGILGGGVRSSDPKEREKATGKFSSKSLGKGEVAAPKTNAEIGAIHEFGEFGMPVRSFLRVPIATELNDVLNDETDLLKPETLKELVETKSLVPWLKKIGAAAELTVQDAFDTGGRGMWLPSNWSKKKNAQTLVETTQLRKSITSKVQR